MSNQASVQDEFLQTLLKGKTPASVYLINGIRLSGQVASFDSYVVLLESPSGHQMVFKHAISTVMPSTGERAPRSLPNAEDNRARTSRA
ncbi:RNA chaperone Hfq [Paraburkholderia elongata]|uniref:RNA-binding protein Hfq n=1 Tax=Paraburkholderia elongata TaxID=2675747 RepID=A0A972NMN7_9BURK|nr:RNA chaperone Hfq [Paraburkholderia elongata]NPT56328.1 RNA chaperone Hfq [Paraburkholderia elongata]NPT56346.1 RNA chaperone Hfq [Paraburkholderia elongata]NPT56359.1 RNA chaperone Hfq [Paraburkholderia elongata]